jgi:Hemagglutinin repeat/The  BURPS668_1122 family of deaminases
LKALYAAQAAQALFSPGAGQGMNLNGQTGADAIAQTAQGKGGIDFKIGVGASDASTTNTSHDETAYGSHIGSNGNVTLAATGGDLNIIGSQISGDNIALAATHNLNLLSQAENHTLKSSNQNISAGVGILIGSSGFGIYAEAAGGEGHAHGNGLTHTDSTVDANGTLTLISGNDTTIKGAQLTGNTVLASIGNNLLIQSEQDTDDYASKQFQGSGQVVIGYGGMSSGGGINLSQTKINSHYASVSDVSGISAGDGGFDISVGGNTHLIGGVIASSADPSKNVLDTGSLTYESIHNEANYSASSIGIGGGYGSGDSQGKGAGWSGGPSLSIPQNNSSSSETKSGIAQGTIQIRDNPNQDLNGLDRNPALNNQALAPIFNEQKIQEQLEMGRVAGQVGMTAAGDLSSYMAKHATTEKERASWSAGGTNKTLLHGVVGAGIAALGSGDALQGAAGAVGSQLVIRQMSDYLVKEGYKPDTPEYGLMLKLASTAVGAAFGGGAGAATALDGVEYNDLHHFSDYLKELHACQQDSSGSGCGAILQMYGDQSVLIAGPDSGNPNGTVANIDSKTGQVVSYTITGLGGQPLLIMQQSDYMNYLTMVNAGIGFTNFMGYNSPEYALQASNFVTDAIQGQFGQAGGNLAGMFTNGSYWRDMGIGMVGAVGAMPSGIGIIADGAAPEAVADSQLMLTQQIADLRATLPGRAQTSGNMGAAQIDLPGVQSTMAASSQISAPSAEQQAQGFVGSLADPTFQSTVVPTASGYPLLRNVDSEAQILNNVANQLGSNTAATGSIVLLTERPPCASCSDVIQQFQNMYPNIKLTVLDNGGSVISPTQKSP